MKEPLEKKPTLAEHQIPKKKTRKDLHADALFKRVRNSLDRLSDPRRGNALKVSIGDAAMSAFAMFSLKDPSLLAFEHRRCTQQDNLQRIYHMDQIPCDTQMRAILDEANSEEIRYAFKDLFGVLQRGKVLEPYSFLDDSYLLSLDGTGYYSSKKMGSDQCCEKKHKNGSVTYYQQMLGAAIVHPDLKEVIPLAPEPIIQQDGHSKNDCERNAAKRFLKKFREDHPRLPITVIEDALSANAPHIRALEKYQMHYILGVKPGDHDFLFKHVERLEQKGEVTEWVVEKDNVTHRFKWTNQVPLNESSQEVLVNFLEYWEESEKGVKHFSWVTDFTITKANVLKIMQGGRSRWKIENETFNTLKNQGYHLEHNYGLGEKNLSVVFMMLMMLAFLVDQIQQACCWLFRAVWEKSGSKRRLWEDMRSLFKNFTLRSMQQLYEALLYGHQKSEPDILLDSS